MNAAMSFVKSPGRLIRKQERPYQRRDRGAILASIKVHPCTLYVLPTGGGKTFVFGAVAKHFAKTVRVCVVVHKTVLTVKSIAESIGVPVSSVGTLVNGQWTNPNAKVLVCMVRSLALKIERGECDHNFGLVILDEAHRSLAKTHRIVVDHFKAKQATILGVTATPERPDGVRMDEIYTDMVRGPSFAELTEWGFIARPVYYAPTKDLLPVLKGAKKAGKDYAAKSLSTPCIAVVGGLVKQWKRRAPKDGGTLIFAVDIAHAAAIAAEFRSQGVKSIEVATSHMKRADVLKVFARLKSGATKIVINVMIAVEGFDAPGISCLIIARPTMSKGLHIQMLGRALRKACGCQFACNHDRPVILDHTINSLTLGKAEWYVAPGLDQEPEGPKYGTAAPGRACPDCGKITWSDGSSCGRCTECDYEFTDYDDPTRLVPSVDGDLIVMPDEPSFEFSDLNVTELPPIEQAIMSMLRQRKSLREIASQIGISYQGVQWRLSRIRRRTSVISSLPSWTAAEVRRQLVDVGLCEKDADLMSVWWATSSQSEAARRIGLPIPSARKRIVCAIELLSKAAGSDGRIRPLEQAITTFWNEGSMIRPRSGAASHAKVSKASAEVSQ